MSRSNRIYLGVAIFLLLGFFSFSFNHNGIEWVWFDMPSAVIGLVISGITLAIILRNAVNNSKAGEVLDLREFEKHEIDGYTDEEFV